MATCGLKGTKMFQVGSGVQDQHTGPGRPRLLRQGSQSLSGGEGGLTGDVQKRVARLGSRQVRGHGYTAPSERA